MKRRTAQSTPGKPRKRKWLRRTLWAVGIAVVLILLVPFVFTGPLLRLYLKHSIYKDVPLTFRSAWLSPMGQLTVHDAELGDTGEFAGQRLAYAQRADITFHWGEVFGGRVQVIQLTNLDLALRPGSDTPLTLLRPARAGPSATTGHGEAPLARVQPSVSGGAGLQFDELLVSGQVRISGYQPWMDILQVAEDQPLPVHLDVRTAWSATTAQRIHDVSVVVGTPEVAGHPFASAIFKVDAGADQTQLKFERLDAGNLAPQTTAALLKAWPALPPAIARPMEGNVDRITLSGTLTLGPMIAISASAEVHDLSLRPPTTAGTPPFSMEHLSASARVEGTLTGDPLTDLKVSRWHCTWDQLQYGWWNLKAGSADLELHGDELILADMQAQCQEVSVGATAALNLKSGLVTRGRLRTSGVSIVRLRQRLPAEWAAALPAWLDGEVEARVFLSESDREHLAAYVELAGGQTLRVNLPHPPDMPAGPGISAASSPLPGWPGMEITSGILSGTVTWDIHSATLTDISHGRFTADEIIVVPSGQSRDAGTSLQRIKSDFAIAPGAIRLDDFYADLPGNGRLSLEGNYDYAAGQLDDAVLSLNGVDLGLANTWLPEGWSLSGQGDAEWRGTLSPATAELALSLGFSSPVVVTGPGGKITVAGAPVAGGQFTLNRATGVVKIQSLDLGGVTAMQSDAGMTRALRNAMTPEPGGALEDLFNRMASGAYVSFDKIAFSGQASARGVSGTLNGGGVEGGILAEAGGEKAPAFTNLTLKSDVAAEFADDRHLTIDSFSLSNGQLLAEKVLVGANAFTEVSARFSTSQDAAYVMLNGLSFADGRVEGDAAVGFDGNLQSLHLSLIGVHQQTLWRNFYPTVFTAEGPISGKLTLVRNSRGILTGTGNLTADQNGRLKITRQASEASLAQAAKAAMQSEDAVLPENFQEIVVQQLLNYPYTQGKASFSEDAQGLHLQLSYTRAPLEPGDPGYNVPVTVAGQTVNANLEFQLRGGTVTLHNSIEELLAQYVGFKSLVVGAPRDR